METNKMATKPGQFTPGLIKTVAHLLMGEPNVQLSTAKTIRYGTHGSLKIEVEDNIFYDHEQNSGGGILDLICRKAGYATKAQAMTWLQKNDLAPPELKNVRPKISCFYDYREELGKLLFQVLRYEPKAFKQRRPLENGKWEFKVKGTRLVPYRLPELLAAPLNIPVYIVEGEKDVDRLALWGIVSTCNSGGAGNWLKEHAEHLKGRTVIVLPDNDKPGRDHAHKVVRSLIGIAASVRILELPGLQEQGDVSDWIAAGGTVEALLDLAAEPEKIAIEPLCEYHYDVGEDYAPFASELALCDEFAEIAEGQLRWTPGREWMVNNGVRWQKDDSLRRFTTAKTVCRKAASGLDSPKLAAKICSAGTHGAILSLARSAHGIMTGVEEWDKYPMLLNTPDGVIDLETGKQINRDGLLFTQVAGASPSAMPTPIWDKFISEVFDGDLEMVEFMQRMGGYSLTGSIKEQKLFFLHGSGSNGKSVFLDVLRTLGGTFSYNLPSEALMTSRHESHPTMLASLHGKRLAISSEIEESAHWAEARIKAMTGDETMTARYMRQDFFTFRVSHKHIIAGNFKPRLKGDDFAMVRRMVLVPFSQKFEGTRRDNNLLEKLKGEYPGILGWFIEGARKWAATGLAIPAAITAASQQYMSEQDDIGLWVASCCDKVKGARELSSHLFTSFSLWKKGNGEHAGSEKTFSQRLERLYNKKATNKGKIFEGLQLTNPLRDSGTENAYAAASQGY